MKWGTREIGGGLEGMRVGISRQEKGQRCAIISSGQSALHLSYGSFDLLGHLTNGAEVLHPLDSMEDLQDENPYKSFKM